MQYLTSLLLAGSLIACPLGAATLAMDEPGAESIPTPPAPQTDHPVLSEPVLADFRKGSSRRPKGGKKDSKKKSKSGGGRQVYA